MRSRGRAERRGGARPLLRGATAAIALLVAAGALTGCTPAAEGTQATPTLRETSIDVAAPPAYTAAREAGLALRDDSLALLTATDGTVAGAARTDLLVAIGALNASLEGVSADAITTATTAAGEQRTALAERVLGLATSTLASGRGSTSRRAVLTDAVEQLRSVLASGAAVAPAAVAVIEAREPLVPEPGSGFAPPPRPAPPAAPRPTTAPAPTQEPAPEPPAPEQAPEPAPAPEPTEAPQPTAEPLPQPEPTAVLPPRTCADDPRLCTPAPEPTIGGPLT
ncbi:MULTISPECIES: hypothetical protein [unclassified Rathayibacter]|uniref:hypothetical protein n=1 Tax=unclassified Rathayibacter TaxID=2609250 RepID=UPI0011B0ED0E|nr:MULTISPECIES: hypothetical protein [unclassified Rathayibacter]